MYLPLEPALAIPFFFVLGLVFGSFGNVIIGRVPMGQSINGRSHCPNCKRILTPLELIPVLSWVFLRAKCYGCKKPISFQYPLVELIVGFLFLFAVSFSSFDVVPAIALSMTLWAMLLITIIDARTQTIPDSLSIALAIAGGFHLWLAGSFTLSGAILALLFMGAQWGVSQGKWMGSGDVFLGGALGLFVGHWSLMLVGLMAAYIIGAFVAVILLASKSLQSKSHISFGPFLILGSLVAFFFGSTILTFLFPF